MCVCLHTHTCTLVSIASWGQESLKLLGTRLYFYVWRHLSHKSSFKSPSAEIFHQAVLQQLGLCCGRYVHALPTHCSVDYCAAITSYGNLAPALFFSQGVLSTSPRQPCRMNVSLFYFSSPLSLKFLLLDSIWTTVRVRIETKQKSITSLSDVDFQIGEKAPGIKQTMCGIFLEGAFFFFLSF